MNMNRQIRGRVTRRLSRQLMAEDSENRIKELKLDSEKQDQLIRLLDSVVIKLEGGSDFDLTVLDLPDPEDEEKKRLGILGLAGFMSVCDRVVVLWQPVYFTWLRCNFEESNH